jgi:hypothetical protein
LCSDVVADLMAPMMKKFGSWVAAALAFAELTPDQSCE